MVRAADGSTIILDDRGIVQTWQEGQAENVDGSHPLMLNLYLPATVRQIHLARLRFRLLPFRAYETGAASGGYYGSSTQSRQVLINTGYEIQTAGTYTEQETYEELSNIATYTYPDGTHSHTTGTVSTHNHGLPSPVDLRKADGGTVTFVASNSHSHDVNSGGEHTHYVVVGSLRHSHAMPRHYHQAYTGEHSHDFSVPDHTHPLQFGIYEGTTPINVTVKVNGVDRTSALGGPFNSDQADLDIAPYLTVGQWNTIELGSGRLGRIDATVFVQVLITV